MHRRQASIQLLIASQAYVRRKNSHLIYCVLLTQNILAAEIYGRSPKCTPLPEVQAVLVHKIHVEIEVHDS